MPNLRGKTIGTKQLWTAHGSEAELETQLELGCRVEVVTLKEAMERLPCHLFPAQRRPRVQARGTAGRQIGREQRGAGQQDHD